VRGEAGRARGPLPTAATRGTLAFVWVALAGWALAFAEYAATGLYRPWSWIKIGLLYVLASCGVTVDVSGPAVGPNPARVRLALTLGTALVLWVSVRAGRTVARSARGARSATPDAPGSRSRLVSAAGWGTLPAVPLAVLTTLAALLVTLSFPGSGVDRLRPIVWEAFVLPLALAAAAGAGGAVADLAGAVTDREEPFRGVEIAAGGWRMFVVALSLSFAAVLTLAAIEPDVARSYARGLDDLGVGGAVLFGHHVLLLPTQSIDVLAPSMGGTTELVVQGATARLTLTGVDTTSGLALFAGFPDDRGPRFPSWYLVFLAVPAAATVAGGRRASRAVRGARDRMMRGAGAGAVFASLVAGASALATITVANPAGLSGRLGPVFPSTVVLALGWGVAGGVVGALLPVGRQGVLGAEAPPPDPSVTSA
jgi:hypothetical protein